MYTSKISIGGKSFSGTLDFYIIKRTVDIFKTKKEGYTVHLLIKELLELDSEVIRVVLFESINRLSDISEGEFEILLLKLNDRDLEIATKDMITFINELMDKCIPINESAEKKEAVFVDELEEDCQDDWDFNHMEYLWHSVLNRKESFWNITPKNLFSQLDIYKQANKIEEEKVQYI